MKTRMTLIADEGKVLTDGKIYGKKVHLAVGQDGEGFREITEKEYEAIKAEQEAQFNVSSGEEVL